jgi:hypothetical protein
LTSAELRQQAWDFFALQAGQRLTTFNFYIAIASLLSTGLVASFTSHVDIPVLGVLLGSLLMLFSFIFWKLDQRNRSLIKGAERTLKYFEGQSSLAGLPGTPHVAQRFTLEDSERQSAKAARCPWHPWANTYSYYDCFRMVFWAFALVGLLGMLGAVVRLGGWLKACGPWL